MKPGCCAAFAISAIAALSACYSPTVQSGAPCEPATNNCPTGETCQGTNDGNFCVADGATLIDAGARPDTPPGAFCVGSKLLGGVCLTTPPSQPVSLATGTTINTMLTTAGNCSELVAQPGGGTLCVIAGTSIDVPTGATLRAIGPNPIVLAASGTLTISGTLDASSHINESISGVPVTGAGARSATECNAIGADGVIGKNDNGGSGAAGGSFGTAGGAGGNGRNGTAHGMPAAVQSPTRLVGGCPGGKGGDGDGGGGGPTGGAGGGAVYLYAAGSISVTGKVIVSGAGSLPGTEGMFSSGGGGGGGTGGMLGLEAPAISVTGTMFANGGGGGGGAGSQPGDDGSPGSDATVATTAAAGGNGGAGGGGKGGAGATTIAATAGSNGSSNTACAGGGGGGGAGIIRMYGKPTTTGATISPAATTL